MSVKEPLEGEAAAESAIEVPDAEHGSFGWTRQVERVLDDWRTRAWAAQIAHYRVASRLRSSNVWLGLPVVIFTTAIGTSLFATLNEERLRMWLRLVVGGISVMAAILAGIQTFLNFAQRADQHVLAADWYASIRRRIDQQLATPRNGRGDPKKFLDEVRKDMNNVGSQSPEIGERAWTQVAAEFGLLEPGMRAASPTADMGRSATPHRPTP
jgi:hypothetical protein